MSRPLLVAIFAVVAIIVVSWTLGELLRQRKDTRKTRRNAKDTKKDR